MNTINIDSSKNINFKFGNSKISLTNIGVFPGRYEAPKIYAQNIHSAVNSTCTISMSSNCSASDAFQRDYKVLITDYSMFATAQAPPTNLLPTGGIFGAQTQRENNIWPLPRTNLFSAPQNIPTNQINQVPPPFTFGSVPFAAPSSNNNVPTFPNSAQVAPLPGFGMTSTNANNPFLVSTPNFENQASANITSYNPRNTGGPFGYFPQQSGVRNLTGTSVLQFQVGSSSAPGKTRRIRKMVRRTTPR